MQNVGNVIRDILDVVGEEREYPWSGILNDYLMNRTDDRAPGVHVSDLVKGCARKICYKLKFPDKRDPTYVSMQRVFDAGKSAHYWYQNKFHGPAGILFGKWLCPVCGSEHIGKMPKQCETTPLCRRFGWVYQETEIIDMELLVRGSIDGIFIIDDQVFLVDYKTINQKEFEKMTKPEKEHVKQVNLYYWLLKRWITNHPETYWLGRFPTVGVIIYINKEKYTERFFEIKFDERVGKEAEIMMTGCLSAFKENKIDTLPVTCSTKKTASGKCYFSNLCFVE